jgi:hypothetical protein
MRDTLEGDAHHAVRGHVACHEEAARIVVRSEVVSALDDRLQVRDHQPRIAPPSLCDVSQDMRV